MPSFRFIPTKRVRFAPLVAIYYLMCADVCERDVRRLAQQRLNADLPPVATFSMVVGAVSRDDFRSLMYFRLRQKGFAGSTISRVASVFYRGAPALFLACPVIGPGFVVSHGFATILRAKSVGEDCLLSQQVTVGFTDHGGPPTIGDRVRIGAGAKILGPIHVGDDAVIGAGAVVVTDVPSGAVMGGVPATRLEKARDKNKRERRPMA